MNAAARYEHVYPAAVVCLTFTLDELTVTYGSLVSTGSGSATATCYGTQLRGDPPAHQGHRPLSW